MMKPFVVLMTGLVVSGCIPFGPIVELQDAPVRVAQIEEGR